MRGISRYKNLNKFNEAVKLSRRLQDYLEIRKRRRMILGKEK